MVTRSPMVAKAMKPIDPHGGSNKTTDGMPQQNGTFGETTRPANMPKAGSTPSASMFDGPYGGKKPQS